MPSYSQRWNTSPEPTRGGSYSQRWGPQKTPEQRAAEKDWRVAEKERKAALPARLAAMERLAEEVRKVLSKHMGLVGESRVVLDKFNDDVSDCVEGYMSGWASSRKLLAAEVDLRSRGYDVEIGEGQDPAGSPTKCLLVRLGHGLKRT